MASLSLKLPDELMKKLSGLGDHIDDVSDKMLQAGGAILYRKVKGNLQAVIGKGIKYDARSTGQLVSALGVSPARLNRQGNRDIKVGFAENRSDGYVNAKIANIIEYGRSGQKAKPFLKPAEKQAKADVIAEMTKVFEEEVQKL